MRTAETKILLVLAALGMASLFLTGLAVVMGPDFLEGRNDFAALFMGSRQAGSSHLYEMEPQYEAQKAQFGRYMPSVVFTRLPFYALLLKSITWLGYLPAWRVFLALNLLCAFWFFRKQLWGDNLAFLLGASYLPVYAALANGQDIWLVAALFTLAMQLELRRRSFSAGAVLSLCAIKPHLFILVPLVLIVQKRWRFFAGGAAGVAMLLSIGFLVEGVGWVARYRQTLGDPRIHPGIHIMPTLRNFVATTGGPEWLYWALCAGTAATVALVALRSARLETAMAAALAGGLAVNYHAYMSDTVLLLPAFALLRSRQLRGRPFWLWVFLLSPGLWSLWVAGSPYSALISLALLCALTGLAFQRPGPVPPAETSEGIAGKAAGQPVLCQND